ncbi:M1 family metallopeptidase [Streptomyces sp. JJ36]|nr:M1 family metallopeptidase [Streptomyces sp. JJ36]
MLAGLAGLTGCSAATTEPDAAETSPQGGPSPQETRRIEGKPGAPGSTDSLLPDAGNGGYDALHYTLDLTVDPDAAKPLTGTATLRARATQDLSRFNLDLSGLTVSRVTVDGRKAGHRHRGTELTVTPGRALAKDREFEVVVRYGGDPESVPGAASGSDDGWLPTDDGAVVMGEPVGAMTWYPVNNTLRDPATYDVDLTVPRGLAGVSVGRYEGKEPAGDGRTTYRWRNTAQTVPYLMTVAVGKFTLDTSKTRDGVQIVNAVDPRQAEQARSVLADIPEFLAWGEELFGPYPFDSAGAIVDHQPENHVALETLGRPVYGQAPDGIVMAHEYAHQWVGNSVTLADWSEIWLNEGLATYAMWMWDEENGGHTTQEWFDSVLASPAEDPVWAFPPGKPGKPGRLFGKPVYFRGAMALHEVRQAVGDEDFFTLLKKWAAERAGKPSSIDDFVALAERVSGKDLEKVFDVWLYQQGKPAAG